MKHDYRPAGVGGTDVRLSTGTVDVQLATAGDGAMVVFIDGNFNSKKLRVRVNDALVFDSDKEQP